MPPRLLKSKTSSGKNLKVHLKVAAVITAVTRHVPGHRKSAGKSIAAYIPNPLQAGNPVIIELTFPRSGQTFAMQASIRSVEQHPAADLDVEYCPAAQ